MANSLLKKATTVGGGGRAKAQASKESAGGVPSMFRNMFDTIPSCTVVLIDENGDLLEVTPYIYPRKAL